MECGESTSEDLKCSTNFFLLEASGDSHEFVNSKIHQENSAHEIEDDAESSNYETGDYLRNLEEVYFEEDNDELISSSNDEEEQNDGDGHKCSIKAEACKGFVEEKDVSSSSRAIDVEDDEMERNRLFWQTCFEVGYP
ncbi:hypothetical protein P3S68_020867 [Capsicum galapagoense]